MNQYFIYGILIPVIIAVIILAVKSGAEKNSIKKGIIKICPYCRQKIDGQATVCHHCQRDIKV